MKNAPLSYALALGLPGFPCRDTPKNKATDKTPLTKNGFHDASADPHKIREMFSRRCLIGVATGTLSGFDVLDVDPRNGGREWYEANKHKLPATRIHRTRSGGIHLLFKHLAGLRNSAGKVAPGIDVRGDGGYVIWWPAHGLEFKDFPPSGTPE
jgi:Bifunctional DNA primase/polymerase, N-terminal